METKDLLKDWEVPGFRQTLVDTLKAVYTGSASNELLTPSSARAGLVLLNEDEEYQPQPNQYPPNKFSYGDDRYEFFINYLGTDDWEGTEKEGLLVFFFGKELTPYVKYAWNQIRFRSYQRSYYRRSFRAPNNRELYFANQLNFLQAAILQMNKLDYYGDSKANVYIMPLEEQVRYSFYLPNDSMFLIWAAALDAGNETLFQTFEDIVFNKDTVGKVTMQILKALLNSEKEKCWQLVEKLLLAAQRQEGLRQTITESLDECSLGAMKYMMRVIIDEKLFRFAGIIRALDVWAGLGWNAEKDTTVKSFFEKGYHYLSHPEEIPAAIDSQNNADVYMALWAQGVVDVQATYPYLDKLLTEGNVEKQCLALKFADESKHFNLDMPLFEKALASNDIAVLGLAVSSINSQVEYHKSHYSKHFPNLFDHLHQVLIRVKDKAQTIAGKVFSWTVIQYDRNQVLQAMSSLINYNPAKLDIVMSYFDEMDVNMRERLTRIVLPGYADYHWDKVELKPVTPLQRDYAFRILKDRGEYNVRVAFRVIDTLELTLEDLQVFVEMLKRKSANIRASIIPIITKQPDAMVINLTGQLLQGDAEQRTAGLDVALQLKKSGRVPEQVKTWAEEFSNRKTIAQKEEILLTQLKADDGGLILSEENGYTLYNPANIVRTELPPIRPDSLYEQLLAKNTFGLSMPVEKVREKMLDLYNIYLANGEHEYEAESWDGSKNTIILANSFQSNKPYNYKYATKEEEYNAYPLPEVWEAWYKASGLTDMDLYIIGVLGNDRKDKVPEKWQHLIHNIPVRNEMMPAEALEKFTYRNPLHNIINTLLLIHPPADKYDWLIGACTRLFASLPEEYLQAKDMEQNRYYYKNGNGWQSTHTMQIFLDSFNSKELAEHQVKDVWQIFRWRQFNGLPENVNYCNPPLGLICRAFQAGIINEDELYNGLMDTEYLHTLSTNRYGKNYKTWFESYPFLTAPFNRIRETLLDAELKRGDSATTITMKVQQFGIIFGINRFFELLTGLGKTNLYRGYIYSPHNSVYNKTELFSVLLKKCQPAENDTQEIFNKAAKAAQLPEQRLIDAAVYAPQWQKYISSFLGWKGLDSAIWWMHAHTKSSGVNEQNAEAESEIAKYSAVDLQDFKDGAVDKDWFQRAYKELGKDRWQMVYDAAKYISDGNAHRRARLYADVIIGELKLKEVTAKVKDKRDQDYLRLYGLVTLAKANPQKDVLARYQVLQQFHKETKQFGSQKQASENLAYRIAMENLARNAGYTDPLRLSWAMETKQVQEIMAANTQIQLDDVAIGLIIDEEGMADVVAFKGDKQLKAIPPKYKKDKKVLELLDYRKTLREQFSRSRKALEDAMVRADAFTKSELEALFGHPVISKHLEKLIFISGDQLGFWHNGKLSDANGKDYTLEATSELRIAHCTDLYASGQWSGYQHYCFTKSLQQPFKQIFRELYLPLEEELKERTISRRYAGHQVQPSQTVALLKGRGWKVDYEDGLQKVFHKNGFVAKLYAMADWFSPADVESPTLETIEFHHLKTGKSVPFEEIPSYIFSEVMRDVDLVVSVAHVGGVDPEASHSSIELRKVLVEESARLFKLNNVTVKGNHVFIKGHYGEYSVHLGSAVVHQLPGNYLSILPVHSQHRGRIFLPFADDDPRSAELISKILLLARDNEIQDPTVLRQLQTTA
ncbi:MAG: DUF4132 domain-containing protein [Chitinophaga sp.]|uniref:DUF4132 domain-containing protein n=1 Tax=Chitinophaga sp. TaxID=1869181 RepID=UPI0025C16DCB|nr:DUF4132 domain-containing protein [Chitinophaga sp.]MBV8251782.1 DUF4132 domain-containing protein [Chitinophaga sp.]